MRLRNHVVYTRLSDKEYEQFLSKVDESGQTIQAYVIDAVLSGHITSAEEIAQLTELSKALKDIDAQLRGMGTNLNQMAHVANGKGALPVAESMSTIAEQVQDVKKEVDSLWLPIRQSIARNKVNPL